MPTETKELTKEDLIDLVFEADRILALAERGSVSCFQTMLDGWRENAEPAIAEGKKLAQKREREAPF